MCSYTVKIYAEEPDLLYSSELNGCIPRFLKQTVLVFSVAFALK